MLLQAKFKMMSQISATLFFALLAFTTLEGQERATCEANAPCPACDPGRTGTELDALRAGNARFRTNPKHVHQSVGCASRLACCQRPFAVILSCADSRVPPEVVFDQGIGDLFIVRNAGNVATAAALGSIEYAVEHLRAKLVVVMGHQRCGAVSAAFCPRPGPHLDAIWDLIRPAVAKPLSPCGDHVHIDENDWDRAVRKNVGNMVRTVSEDLHRERRNSDVTVIGAYYKLDDGMVDFLK